MNRYFGPAMVLLVLLVTMLAISGGVALAATVMCSTSPCNGTNSADSLFGRKAVDDEIYGKDGGDTIWDFSCTPEEGGAACVDHDLIFGGAGSDEIAVNDGNTAADQDTVNCGNGSNDHASVDPNDIVNANCEFTHVYLDSV